MLEPLRNKAYRALRRSESFFRTDMVYLAKGGAWLLFSQVIASALGLISAIFFARLLPQETFGIYKYILAATGVIGAISLTGYSTAVVRAVSRGFEGEVKKGFWLILRWGVIMTLISFIAAGYYFINDNSVLGTALIIAGVFLPIGQSSSIYGSYLHGKKKFKEMSICNAIRNALSVITLVFTLLITKEVLIIVFIFFAVNSLSSLVIYLFTVNYYKLNTLRTIETERFGKHLSLVNVVSGIAHQIDKILTFHFLGAAPLAIYSFSRVIPDNLEGLFKNVATLAMPEFSKREKKDLKKAIFRKAFILSAASIPVVAIYIIFAPTIFDILFPRYSDSVIYSQIYSLYLILVGGLLLNAYFTSQKQTQNIYIMTTTQNILKILTVSGFFFGYGLLTLITLQLISYFLSVMLGIFLVKRS